MFCHTRKIKKGTNSTKLPTDYIKVGILLYPKSTS